jgi:hypothetical protein
MKQKILVRDEERYKMDNNEAVIKEIEEIPEPFLEQVLDFVHFLKRPCRPVGTKKPK